MRKQYLFTAILLLSTTLSFAQLREVPQPVKDAFAAQYSGADSVEYNDNLVNVQVRFMENGARKQATYSNKGNWRETEQEWSFDQLNADVKDGFAKSKYSGDEWKVAETKIVTRPGKVELFRVKVQKSDVQKRYLYFTASGKLESEGITL